MKLIRNFLIAALTVLSTAAAAGDFDGAKALICAPVTVMDCVRGDECFTVLPEDVDAPAFMRFDFEKKSVIGPKVSSEILLQENTAEEMLLQGREAGYGWTIVIDSNSGEMSVTLARRNRALVMYGSCTPL